MSPLNHPLEDYLAAVQILHGEGALPSVARLSDLLGVSRPTVSRALGRMQRYGWLASRRPLVLTEEGRGRANQLVRHHHLAERWLVDELGMDWAHVHQDAGLLEHALTPLVARVLWERLGRPTTCPHGNPLPGLAQPAAARPSISLAEARPGAYILVRLAEPLESWEEGLRRLDELGMRPGGTLTVSRRRGDAVATDTPQGAAVWPLTVARQIFLAPAPEGCLCAEAPATPPHGGGTP